MDWSPITKNDKTKKNKKQQYLKEGVYMKSHNKASGYRRIRNENQTSKQCLKNVGNFNHPPLLCVFSNNPSYCSLCPLTLEYHFSVLYTKQGGWKRSCSLCYSSHFLMWKHLPVWTSDFWLKFIIYIDTRDLNCLVLWYNVCVCVYLKIFLSMWVQL